MATLMTVTQVAEAIDRSPKSVYRYIYDKKIVAEKNGHGYEIHRSEVIRFLQRERDAKFQVRINKVRAS